VPVASPTYSSKTLKRKECPRWPDMTRISFSQANIKHSLETFKFPASERRRSAVLLLRHSTFIILFCTALHHSKHPLSATLLGSTPNFGIVTYRNRGQRSQFLARHQILGVPVVRASTLDRVKKPFAFPRNHLPSQTTLYRHRPLQNLIEVETSTTSIVNPQLQR